MWHTFATWSRQLSPHFAAHGFASRIYAVSMPGRGARADEEPVENLVRASKSASQVHLYYGPQMVLKIERRRVWDRS